MIRSKAFIFGISGVLLFIVATVAGGLIHPGYDHGSQFISELYAEGAPRANLLKYAGYIPSGLFIILFCLQAVREVPKSPGTFWGFLITGLFYGAGTILAAFFPCDAGCSSFDPSLSQLIHNLIGFLTYITVPFAIIILSLSARKWPGGEYLSYAGYFLGIVAVSFVYLLFSQQGVTHNKGLLQRVIELSVLTWITLCAFYINRKKQIRPRA